MATEIKVEIIQRQTVKPSSPTPHHLRNYKLSILDQMAHQTYIPILLFYPNAADATSNNVMATNERCQYLMQSLAKTLTHFYPLAGRIKGDAAIECNDDGAEFVEARVKCSLSEIFEHPDAEMLRQFLPVEPESREAGTGTLLRVQVNLFECGGMSIGFSISHKFGDATTLSTFINCWTAAAHDQSNMLMLPKFGAASLFSPLNFTNSEPQPSVEVDKEKFITRRFVFDASKIAALQSKVTSSVVPKPTRVEAVSALIWKCKIEASSRSSSNMSGTSLIRPSVFCHTVNMRKMAVPPLPENLVGNLVDYSTTNYSHSGENTTVIDLKGLVAKIRGGLEERKELSAAGVVFDSNEAWKKVILYINLMKNDDIDKFMCSSWCRFPFYEADFGWGKPSWVSYVAVGLNNVTVLMDKRDDNGIEAWVTLNQENMALFESNKELLEYASLNPRVTN
ncbi:PREDICTED: BAHD acyltransferase [Prunus dulcis]|uniref:PREDICTED: BAHD acyltransferase n=2 Tax=Prunus dulcis TaxID=3755 RepID=A0A5E4G6G1_PRUDU|nr:stemmadenine O-acetyltransferase-like [Prunus dulcis]VVA35324.1 PREDICTED: BAHD acyltransferase [Prunus dulcis]